MPANTNLIPSFKVFVGRERELARLAELFAAGERLVSLVGAAGIGKTRVALEYMEQSLADYAGAGGAWFCDFTESHSIEDICREVSRALQPWLPGQTGHSVAGLGEAIGQQGRLLLVLDNCEQISDQVSELVAAWLPMAPEARFLVTSRERLRVSGESAIELGPLPLPKNGESGVDAIAASDATRLFLDRARRVVADYALDEDSAPVIAEIVRRLDGMPLAIELAAARVGVLRRPADLLSRLATRLDVLTSHARGVPDRHRTLRAAIDWSWELLDQWERAGLAQLSVFRGGFSIDAADQVVRVQMYPNPPDVIGGLQWLRDKSLVWADTDSAESRFGLYLSVRDYAAEKLAELGLQAEAFARHAEYYRRLVAPLADRPLTADDVALLSAEEENLLAAFARCLDGDAAMLADGLGCLLALEPLRAVRGPWDEYAGRLTQAIDAPAFAELESVLRARSHHARGRMIGLRGRLSESAADFSEALEHARAAADKRLEGNVLLRLGVLANNVNDYDRARLYYQQSLPLLRDVGDRYTEGQALANLAVVDGQLGNYEAARSGFEAAQKLYAEVGARQLQARTIGNLGTILQDEGELRDALLHFERAISSLQQLGNRRDAAVFVGAKGTLFQERGDLELAEAQFHEAIAVLRELGDDPFEALFLGHLGTIAAARDDVSRAGELFDEVDNRWRRAPAGPGADQVTLSLLRGHIDLALARAAAAEGDTAAAERRRHQVRALLAEVSAGEPPPQRVRIATRILRRALAADTGDVAVGDDVLAVGPGGRWFSVAGGERADLYKRSTLRGILWRLVEEHRDNPGRGLELDDLFRAGWPGERVARTAAANRVRVALTTLRKLGLRECLVTHSDGYLIDPQMRVVVTDG